MNRSSLTTVLLLIAGAIIGFFVGAVLGFAIGRGLDLLAREDFFAWRSFYGTMSGAVAGLIAGAGTGGIGIRTRLGLEWPLLFGIATLIGFSFQGGSMASDLALLAGIGAAACWLVTLLLRWVFGRWLSRGTLETKFIVGYLVIFGAAVLVVPLVLRSLVMLFSF